MTFNVEGELELTVPYGTTEAEMQKVLQRHMRWIAAQETLYQERIKRFSALYEYRSVLCLGAAYPVVQGESCFSNGTFSASCPKDLAVSVFHAAESDLKSRFFAYAERFAFSPKELTFRRMKSKWGRCDALGRIRLSVYLAMLPPRIADYVIVHELCHLRVLNHSPSFWREVESILPDYAERKRELSEYEFLIELYERNTFIRLTK